MLLSILQQQVFLLGQILFLGADADVADDLHRLLNLCGKKKGALMASFYHSDKQNSTLSDSHSGQNKGTFLYAIEKMKQIDATGALSIDLAWLNNNYQRTLTHYVHRCSAARLRQLQPPRRYAVLICLVNAISHFYVTQVWGEGKTSSSDGQRFQLKRRILQRTYSHRLRDYALEFYSFVADNYASFYSMPIECTDRDAAYVLDGVL